MNFSQRTPCPAFHLHSIRLLRSRDKIDEKDENCVNRHFAIGVASRVETLTTYSKKVLKI